jgi:hypothetical protein
MMVEMIADCRAVASAGLELVQRGPALILCSSVISRTGRIEYLT